MAVLTASCNIPLAYHDRLSPNIRAVFPDSKIASGYRSTSTKATCILNLAVAPVLIGGSSREHESPSLFPFYRWLK